MNHYQTCKCLLVNLHIPSFSFSDFLLLCNKRHCMGKLHKNTNEWDCHHCLTWALDWSLISVPSCCSCPVSSFLFLFSFFFVSLLQVIFFQVLTHHEHEIVCLAYSRDDRFLASVGDYRECSVVVWCTRDLVVLASSFARHPVHDIMWDPYTANEFCSLGQEGSVLFWLLDETSDQMTLNVRKL